MMRALALVLMVTACSPAPEVNEEPTPTIEALAPEPQVADPELNYGDAGQQRDVSVDRPFAVVLPSESSTGLIWNVVETPPFVLEAGEGAVRLAQDAIQGAMPGASTPHPFYFVARAAGSGDLVLQQVRFDGSEDQAGETFRVTIVAR
ncbi:MAG: protease inhibitor I42 family protein [Hyphomonadaceae bacterium JAD_PAG50586_4]|nr:MAG: protease inhibitor I42 family protein [Hyphomonadaceae bacterium JAD_PAG50586_4]